MSWLSATAVAMAMVSREQAQLHAGRALRDAVAHGRHAAGHLGRGAQAARLVLDQVGVMLQRLVRRQHVVVGVDDADVGRAFGHHLARNLSSAGMPAKACATLAQPMRSRHGTPECRGRSVQRLPVGYQFASGSHSRSEP
jgi:hypothetical protein